MQKPLETASSLIEWNARGFFKITTKPAAIETLDSARELMQALMKVTVRSRPALLFDTRGLKSQESGARAYFAGMLKSGSAACCAVVVSSFFQTLLINCYAVVAHKTPIKFFTDEAKAAEWLVVQKQRLDTISGVKATGA